MNPGISMRSLDVTIGGVIASQVCRERLYKTELGKSCLIEILEALTAVNAESHITGRHYDGA